MGKIDLDSIIKTTDEKCEYCGEYIRIGEVNCLGTIYKNKLTCPCIIKKEAEEKQKKIEAGKLIYCKEIKTKAGLLKRHLAMTFENINIWRKDEAQTKAIKTCLQWCDEYIKVPLPKGLILLGGVGCGKTYLTVAILNRLIDNLDISDDTAVKSAEGYCNMHSSPYLFIRSADLLENIKSTFSTNTTENITDKYKNSKVLIIDDLGAEKSSEWAREQLLNIIDFRYNEYLPTIISANLTQEELKAGLGDRTVDRLKQMCDLVVIKAKSHRGDKQ